MFHRVLEASVVELAQDLAANNSQNKKVTWLFIIINLKLLSFVSVLINRIQACWVMLTSGESKLPAAKAKLDEATKEMLKQHINFLQRLLHQYGDDEEAPSGVPASSAAAPAAPAAVPAAPAAVPAEPAASQEMSHGQIMENLFSTVSCLGVQCCLTCCVIVTVTLLTCHVSVIL